MRPRLINAVPWLIYNKPKEKFIQVWINGSKKEKIKQGTAEKIYIFRDNNALGFYYFEENSTLPEAYQTKITNLKELAPLLVEFIKNKQLKVSEREFLDWLYDRQVINKF